MYLISGRSARAAWVLAWLACSGVTLAIFANPKTARVDGDEIYWIGSTYYYHLAFEQRDWKHPDWKLMPARENPPVAKYVIGLGLALAGRHVTTMDGIGSFYAFYETMPIGWEAKTNDEKEFAAKHAAVTARMNPELRRQVNETRQVYVASELLVPARVTMLICATLTSLLVFFFGASVSGRATGLLASQFLLVHPAVVYAYNHAMSDAVALLFGTAAAFAAWRFFQRFTASEPMTGRTVALFALLNGCLLGLACGAKMNWLTVALLFGAAVVVVAAQAWRRGDRQRTARALVCGAGSFAMGFAVFVAINPAILGDFSGGLVAPLREQQLGAAIQARALAGITVHLVGLAAKYSAMAKLTLVSPLHFTLAALAVVIACLRAPRVGVWFVAAWWVIAFVLITAWIPFQWRRYVLPSLVPFTLLLAHMLVAAVVALVARVKAPSGSSGVSQAV